MIQISYILKENRTKNDYYVGKKYCLNITKQHYYNIIWFKYFFNRSIIIFKLKRIRLQK